jgi:hypothetical protein
VLFKVKCVFGLVTALTQERVTLKPDTFCPNNSSTEYTFEMCYKHNDIYICWLYLFLLISIPCSIQKMVDNLSGIKDDFLSVTFLLWWTWKLHLLTQYFFTDIQSPAPFKRWSKQVSKMIFYYFLSVTLLLWPFWTGTHAVQCVEAAILKWSRGHSTSVQSWVDSVRVLGHVSYDIWEFRVIRNIG